MPQELPEGSEGNTPASRPVTVAPSPARTNVEHGDPISQRNEATDSSPSNEVSEHVQSKNQPGKINMPSFLDCAINVLVFYAK